MNVLAFGAHPDDIETGMAGTIAKYAMMGHKVLMVVTCVPNKKEKRIKEATNAAKVLGADVEILGIDPHELIFLRNIITQYDGIINNFNPDIVYTHWNKDSHQDHQSVANAVIATTRKNNCTLYMYEQTIPGGLTPHGFMPQVFVDISDTFSKKIESLKAHKSQVDINGGNWLDYGLTGRAMYRGYQIGVKYAEAFEVIKRIERI